MCPQPYLEVGRLQPMHEDCLFLNIWAPATPSHSAAEPLGVLVFFYGGSFVIGDSWEFGFYEGSALSATANRVVRSFARSCAYASRASRHYAKFTYH